MELASEMADKQIHATCVSLDNQGVILRGPSGSGKSDLALRLIDQGGMLIADDRVDLIHQGGSIIASSPQEISGLLEVRGVGIIRLACLASIAVGLVVDLVDSKDMQRLPETVSTQLYGIEIRYLELNAFESSTPAKIRLALGASRDAMVEPSW